MCKNLILEFVKVTEKAAIKAFDWVGRGDATAADQAAVDAMRKAFAKISIDGVVVIGEGERDQAPMLYIGEKLGTACNDSPKVDVALDPLECTSVCADGGHGALSVIAIGDKGSFLHAPDVYMDKIAVGPKAKGCIDLNKTPTDNVLSVAKALSKKPENMTVTILDRKRHAQLIKEVLNTKARVKLIKDGDVSAAILTAYTNSGIDMLLGTGGAPEGVLASAAMKCLDGDLQARLIFKDSKQKERASKMGVTNFDKVYNINDLTSSNVTFVATGVTDGSLLKGVRPLSNGLKTFSLVMNSKTGTIRKISTFHSSNFKE